MRTTVDEPIKIFKLWLSESKSAEPINPNAMTLATADSRGRPSARMVLLKDVDARGFVFYTNLGSQKALELNENPYAALCFYWKTLGKQVRVEGSIEEVEKEEADIYFKSRPRLSQLAAWASKQSNFLEDRTSLEKRIARYAERFNSTDVPRPEFWSGYRLKPCRIELWKEEAFRLHDRTLYTKEGNEWLVQKLYP